MPQLLGKEIGSTGYGLMGLTWAAVPTSEENAFEALKTSLATGCNFWNAGEFYGTADYNSLHLLNRYFTKYPEDASKVVLSIKGALTNMSPDGTPEGVKRSIANCIKLLDGKKKIDIFECARVDKKVPIETTLKALEEEVTAGHIGGIALSEVSAATIQRAIKVTKIVAIEVELSLWSLDVLSNGVAAACAKHNIPLIAYSPIGRGILSGQIKSAKDIPENDMRRTMPRYSEENFGHNIELVQQLESIAKEKGCTPAQLAINWVKHLSKRDGNPVIIPIPGSTTATRIEENAKDVTLNESDLAKIDSILQSFEVRGTRYGAHGMVFAEG